MTTSALTRFAAAVDAVTYEFENVPAKTAAHLDRLAPFGAHAKALGRAGPVAEKTFPAGLGARRALRRRRQRGRSAARDRLGRPAILKTPPLRL